MKVSTKWEGDMAYTMMNPSGNTMHMDPNGDGVSPMESVLGGLAGCMGIDIVMVLKPFQDKIERLEIERTAKEMRNRRNISNPLI
ncbi:MAG: hypothetical protein U5K84_06845 [Alkalibacterium sp.]|nr:hypothetical protein [Alkalibacterium sp.]